MRVSRVPSGPIVAFALVSLLAPSSASAQAAPFGLRFGMTAATLRKSVTLYGAATAPFYFTSDSAPKPNAEFTEYLYVITPKYGLCSVMATSDPVATDAGGEVLRRRFDELASALRAKYGKGVLTDELEDGSIWTDPGDWMEGLYHKERTLEMRWSDTLPGARLPAGLHTIILFAKATSVSDGSVGLVYASSSVDSCMAEADSARNASL